MTNLCLLICSHSEGEDLFNSFTDEVLNGLRQYCVEADLELSIFGSSVSKLNKINVHKEMQRRGVDGGGHDLDYILVRDPEMASRPECKVSLY